METAWPQRAQQADSVIGGTSGRIGVSPKVNCQRRELNNLTGSSCACVYICVCLSGRSVYFAGEM